MGFISRGKFAKFLKYYFAVCFHNDAHIPGTNFLIWLWRSNNDTQQHSLGSFPVSRSASLTRAKNFIITSHPPIKLSSCVIRATPAAAWKRNAEKPHTLFLCATCKAQIQSICQGDNVKSFAGGGCRAPIYFYHADFRLAVHFLGCDGDWASRVSPHDLVIHFRVCNIMLACACESQWSHTPTEDTKWVRRRGELWRVVTQNFAFWGDKVGWVRTHDVRACTPPGFFN